MRTIRNKKNKIVTGLKKTFGDNTPFHGFYFSNNLLARSFLASVMGNPYVMVNMSAYHDFKSTTVLLDNEYEDFDGSTFTPFSVEHSKHTFFFGENECHEAIICILHKSTSNSLDEATAWRWVYSIARENADLIPSCVSFFSDQGDPSLGYSGEDYLYINKKF